MKPNGINITFYAGTESEYTEREIQQFIFHPGLSTNDKVTSYSGRGVGMDVVSISQKKFESLKSSHTKCSWYFSHKI